MSRMSMMLMMLLPLPILVTLVTVTRMAWSPHLTLDQVPDLTLHPTPGPCHQLRAAVSCHLYNTTEDFSEQPWGIGGLLNICKCFTRIHLFRSRLRSTSEIDVSQRPRTSHVSSRQRHVSSMSTLATPSHVSLLATHGHVSLAGSQHQVRRLQAEQKLFTELLEMKRQQIRVGRINEAVLVKRIADKYNHNLDRLHGLKTYNGQFSFDAYEKHLYSELRKVKSKYFNSEEDLTSLTSFDLDGQRIVLPKIDNRRDHLRIYLNKLNKS